MPPSKRKQPKPELPRAKRSRKGAHAHTSIEEVEFVAATLDIVHGNAIKLKDVLDAGKIYLDSDAAVTLA